MKHFLATTVLVAAVALVTWFVTYRLTCQPAVHAAVAKGDALEWLRADFRLNDTQFARIEKLHESYATVCEGHCRAIQQVMKTRDALKSAGSTEAAALAATEHELETLRTTCETAITAHVREVAAMMSPEEGSRYLALVLPMIADFDHRGAPDVGVGHRGH